MAVPFLDVSQSYRQLATQIQSALIHTLEQGQYVLGQALEQFEHDFAEYTHTRYCIGVGTGLDALKLTLQAWDIGVGDEVIVPSHTAFPTWLAVTAVGAQPVPWEPKGHEYHADPDLLEELITPRTRAVIPVHLYGQCVDMQVVQHIARRHDILILEDAAQAHGAKSHGHHPGFWGDAAAWSFYPSKNLGAFGDAGAITTNDRALRNRLHLLRNYGSTVKYVNEIAGSNSRLDDLQATILRVKLPYLESWNACRQHIAQRYLTELRQTSLILPSTRDVRESVWHVFPVQHRDRDRLQRYLNDCGVQTLIHYPIAPHLQRAYQHLGFKPGSLPIAESIAQHELSLPMGPHLTEDQVTTVIQCLLAFAR
ncbi:MAG: erythromycin biosynthesis sensory transduction protein eryC1 [Sulfobacillus acidophilus]|uniref:Erythromycin biosynthesis sensory transduction protein eryC1 n=1 Tax=Sulfobacillus acidophilus TaxID=53633 RepID=A0A2T2WP19_9FIRM|nr:MAG: erythromycin biosynthesis sensory transduction protein eryC1 [Sulfobacillus acidophilus]